MGLFWGTHFQHGGESRSKLMKAMPSSTILGKTWTNQCRGESEYVWTGEFDMNTLRSVNVWTRIFSYPERKNCGLKNIGIRVDGAAEMSLVSPAGHGIHSWFTSYVPRGQGRQVLTLLPW